VTLARLAGWGVTVRWQASQASTASSRGGAGGLFSPATPTPSMRSSSAGSPRGSRPSLCWLWLERGARTAPSPVWPARPVAPSTLSAGRSAGSGRTEALLELSDAPRSGCPRAVRERKDLGDARRRAGHHGSPSGPRAVATLGFHPSEARDREGAATALLKHLLIWGASLRWRGTDSRAVWSCAWMTRWRAERHKRSWSYAKLARPSGQRSARSEATERPALDRLHLGWWTTATRGAAAGGGGERVARVPGRVYPSPPVKYRDRAGFAPGRSTTTSRVPGHPGLARTRLVDRRAAWVHHMYPDPTVWAKAPDATTRHPGIVSSDARRAHHRRLPRTSTAGAGHCPPAPILRRASHDGDLPGDEFTNAPIERALGLGLRLVSSYTRRSAIGIALLDAARLRPLPR